MFDYRKYAYAYFTKAFRKNKFNIFSEFDIGSCHKLIIETTEQSINDN